MPQKFDAMRQQSTQDFASPGLEIGLKQVDQIAAPGDLDSYYLSTPRGRIYYVNSNEMKKRGPPTSGR